MSVLRIVSVMVAASLIGGVAAQQKIKPFWGNPDSYVQGQTEITFGIVDQLLAKYPPTGSQNELERQAALQLVDQVVHDTRLDGKDCVAHWAKARHQMVADDFQNPIGKNEVRIYKLYNDGFIARTADATVAFDMFRGGKMENYPNLWSDEVAQQLVDLCDALYLTHNHGDHVDPGVVKMFLAAGKPVIAPENALKNMEGVTHIEGGAIRKLDVKTAKGKKLKTTILPGHQDDLQNDINIVKFPNGKSVAHTGDQYNKEDVEWIRDIHKTIGPLDVLLMNCWINAFDESIAGFNPGTLITGHENELAHHSIDHRESYWLSHLKLADVQRPVVLMTWGEYYTVK